MTDKDVVRDRTGSARHADDTAALSRRGLLIETVASSVASILTASSVTTVLPEVLFNVAKVVRIDRVLTVEMLPHASGDPAPSIFFKWESDVAAALPQLGSGFRPNRDDEALRTWLMPVTRGEAVVTMRTTAPEAVRHFLTKMGVATSLMVPIMINGRHWGQIGFDHCLSEHDWASDDIKILKMLAEVIGAAITRERFLGQAQQHQKLLQAINDSAATLISAPDLTQAITRVLALVADSISVDRILVMEREPGTKTNPGVLVRTHWHAPQVPLNADQFVRPGEVIDPAVQEWLKPLQNGQAVQAQHSTAIVGVQSLLTRLQSCSALIVPIMVDGLSWGHIHLDDCQHEREWSRAEVDVLRTMADLIGTAITSNRHLEELAKANKIIQNSPSILYRLRGEAELPMIYISPNVALLGYDAAELLRSPTLYQRIIPADDLHRIYAAMLALLDKDVVPIPMEFRIHSKDGSTRWVENHYAPVRDGAGRLVEIEGILTDITERKAAEGAISLLARTDALTGLANRITFNERLRQAYLVTQRGGHSFAVLYLDLDHFKEVNDTLGHHSGDQLLKEVSARILSSMREIDLAARLGGDEFAIVQAEVSDPAQAGRLAEKLIETISAPYFLEQSELRIGVSIGIAFATADAISTEALLAQADRALYRSKHAGRGQYRFFSNQIDQETREHLALAEDLRQAQLRGELEIRYQPQVELASGRIVGMEALLRWNHPNRGLLLPEDFLPIAEQFAIIPQLGRWILDMACQQISLWHDAQLNVPVLAINISLTQIKMGMEFVRDVIDSVTRWGIKPSDIELDVTELVLARATLAQSDALDELRRFGVAIAIDEFGGRYSSLDYLRNYRVSRLKIARGMIAAADAEPGGGNMVRAILGLAKELGIGVVAEGVETEAQRALLVAANALAQGQGFYYCHAVSADECGKLLRAGAVLHETGSEPSLSA